MRRFLLLRERAPMMSFGAPAIDDVGPSGLFPTRSMITGQVGCAFAWERSSHHADLTRLQNRLTYAARCDREPSKLTDLQTVMVAGEGMAGGIITPEGWVSYRDAQWMSGDPVMRRREYLVDGEFVVALSLDPADESPTLDEIAHKLDYPEAVVCIGRRPCIPSTRLVIGIVEAESILDALKSVPVEIRYSARPQARSQSLRAIWPETEGRGLSSRTVEVIEDRDWRNNIHTGRRRMVVGRLPVEA